MILEQHYLGCLAQASYFIADPSTGIACVVDPRRDIEVYLERAEKHGVTIKHVLLTHFHADFLAGDKELRERTGATIHLGAAARAGFEFSPLAEGQTLDLGRVRLQALATPGHTPESTSYLVFDLDGSAGDPHAVLTGDCLFIGDVGRPDLMSSEGITREELARQLYASTRTKLMTLPDETIVYPGHGAGSACGKNLSTERHSTIGAQKRENYALQDMTEDAFVESITSGLVPPPAYFPVTAGLNKRNHDTLEDVLGRSLQRLDTRAAVAAQDGGAQLVDVRTSEDFCANHLVGALNVGLDGNFAGWAGGVLDLESDVVLVASEVEAREAAMRLGRIGFDRVIGFVEDEIALGGAEGHGVRVSPEEAQLELNQQAPPFLLDVRQPGEHEMAHIEGAVSIPLGQLPRRLDEVPAEGRILIHCLSGYRSMVAQSLLRRAGHADLADVRGGFEAWEAAGLPRVEGASCS